MMVNWLKKHLFNTWYNTLLTIVSIGFIYWLGSLIIDWAINLADWQVVTVNFPLFFFGRYPNELVWRIWTILGIIISLCGLSWAVFQSKKLSFLKTWLSLIWLLSFLVVLWLLQGGLFLKPVRLDDLSGLILSIFIAAIAILLSFPIGILLALGRQSKLPIIRWFCIIYIETIRALPLIGILFMAQVMVPLLLSPELRFARVIRAIAGFTIFSSAYLAENVRAGLRSISLGQWEAARSLGLNSPLTLGLIILPQALQIAIPSIVGQFISLFKDTSLLAIVGLVDLLGISQSIIANPKFLGKYAEVYLFIALIYWIICYLMSWLSKQLELKQSKR
jgi:general L-amino acid transport system permease protein